MADMQEKPRGRASRFWLFAPFVLFALVVVAWSVGWFYVQDRVEREMDRAVAREANSGRHWDCVDRRVAGFPFRVEVRCAALTFRSDDGMSLSLGASQATAQVYQPRHLIVEMSGPLTGSDGRIDVAGDWSSLRASVRNLGLGTEQVSAVALEPRVTVDGAADIPPLEAASERVEIHARPSPGDGAAGQAVDLVVRAVNATAPLLDELTGDPSPAQVELQARATNIPVIRGRAPGQIAASWRQEGGVIEIALLDIVKGETRLQMTGELGLDEENRPVGSITPRAAGVERLVERAVGPEQSQNVVMMIEALSTPAPEGSPAGLRTLPQLDLRQGRIYVGPFPIPRVEVPPLF
jgi:hypothetical protein